MPADDGLTLLASGRTADVYALDERRVLRRYRDGEDAVEEAAVMTYLAERGFPVPRVYEVDGADLVLERLAGTTLLDSLIDGRTAPAGAAETLAELHTRLHALPPRQSRDPADRILHLDLHPGNVVLGQDGSQDGPKLIDWRNTAEGSPDLDIALTALILAEVAAGSYLLDFAEPAQQMLIAFLSLAGGDPLDQLDRAVAYRLAMSTLSPGEKARMGTAADLVVTSGDATSSHE